VPVAPIAEEQKSIPIKNKLLDACRDPVTKEIFNDPVIAADGITYERSFIEKWFLEGNLKSPVTGLTFDNKKITPNFALQKVLNLIKELK